MADLYRQKVTALAEALEHPEIPTEASEALRGLIDAIVLTPDQGELQIELKGNLAAMLGAAPNATRSPETCNLTLQVVMVAGPGFETATFAVLTERCRAHRSTDVAFVHLTELGYVSDTLEVSSEKTRPMNEIKIQLHCSVHDHAPANEMTLENAIRPFDACNLLKMQA